MRIFITGSAGFIGSHLTKKLISQGHEVVGIDNLNDYYDPKLKLDRNDWLKHPNYHFYHCDICELERVQHYYRLHQCEAVVHLAAQAGVRYSIENPMAYQKSNLEGFVTILELARKEQVHKLIFASSSSVYGDNAKIPFSVTDPVSHPVSFYGATKLANEIMAYSYHKLYHIPVVGLRFFTVYGPWGRPDMAYFKFTDAIMKGRNIDVYNNGDMKRSFTYIDDIVDGIVKAFALDSKYYLLNLGNPETENLMDFIKYLEISIGRPARLNLLPFQAGDMQATCADIGISKELIDFEPVTSLSDGIKRFVAWYKDYFELNERKS